MSTRELSHDTKTQILTAATGLLADRGVQALSFENIAHEADFPRQHAPTTRKAIDRLIASYISDAPSGPLMERPWSRDS